MSEFDYDSFPYELGLKVEYGQEANSVSVREDKPFDVGSVYKTIVATEIIEGIDLGDWAWSDQVPVLPEHDLPDSPICGGKSGATFSIEQLVGAMLGGSDNTATELLVSMLGQARLKARVDALGMHNTNIPFSIRAKLDAVGKGTIMSTDLVICESTAADMNLFYRFLYSRMKEGNLTPKAIELLTLEDAQQGIAWPDGITCFRKSGSVDLESKFSGGVSGLLFSDSDRVLFSVFSCITPSSVTELEDWQPKLRALIEQTLISSATYLSSQGA